MSAKRVTKNPNEWDGAAHFSLTTSLQVGRILEGMLHIGLFGDNYPEILDRIVCQWVIEHMDTLKAMGVELPQVRRG